MSKRRRVGGGPGIEPVVVKDEPLTAMEAKFLEEIERHPHGAKMEDLPAELRHTPSVVDVINKLIQLRRLEMCGDMRNPTYNYVDAFRSKKLREVLTDQEIQAVYSKIEESGDVGIWTRDIRTRTNLMKQRVDKILKKLLSSNLVKAVKSITHKTRRLYMLSHLEPNRDITGGPWYTDTDFDSEFVEMVRKIVRHIFSNSAGEIDSMNATDIEKILSQDKYQRACKVKLETENVLEILQTLYYDGEIEPVVEYASQEELGAALKRTDCKFRARAKPFGMEMHMDLSCAPCGRCNLSLQCTEHGKVSPYTCQYMTRWLQIGVTAEQERQLLDEHQNGLATSEGPEPPVVDMTW